jgi:peptide/nickel transport system substrate-binding protein
LVIVRPSEAFGDSAPRGARDPCAGRLANTYINAVGEKAWFGWPKDDELLRLRAAFADEPDPAKRKELATDMQIRVSENPTHAFMGQWYQPVALRKNVTGTLESPVTIFWNIEKK